MTNHQTTPLSINHQQQAEEEDDGVLFSCRCESAKSVTTLLACLKQVAGEKRGAEGGRAAGSGTSNKVQHATVFCGPTAITFHVHGRSRQSQSSVDMQAGLFCDYYVMSEEIEVEHNDDDEEQLPVPDGEKQMMETVVGGEFGINLTKVLECLSVCDASRTKLCMSYNRQTAIFKLELLEDGPSQSGLLNVAAIPGLAVPQDEDENEPLTLAGAFRASPIVARAILKSEFVRDAIAELQDVAGGVTCTVGIGPTGMELAAVGHAGECLVSLPHAGNDGVFVGLECTPPRLHTHNYPIHSFLSGMRGLDIAEETCISINSAGMIAIQHQVLDTVGNGQPNFVDFIMSCLEDEDDEDEDAESSNHRPPTQLSQQTSNTHDDIYSSMRQEDEEEEPRIPSPRRRSPKRQAPLLNNNPVQDREMGSGSDSDDFQGVVSAAAHLFGTVGDVGASSNTQQRTVNSSSGRRARRYRQRSSSSQQPSPSIQQRSSSNNNNKHNKVYETESEDDEFEDSLDVTAAIMTPSRAKKQRDTEISSSPELLYGANSSGAVDRSRNDDENENESSTDDDDSRFGLGLNSIGSRRHSKNKRNHLDASLRSASREGKSDTRRNIHESDDEDETDIE